MIGCLPLSSPSMNPTCRKCGKKYYGERLVGTGNCFRCGKEGHKIRDCPNIKGQDKSGGKAQASGSNVDFPKKNLLY